MTPTKTDGAELATARPWKVALTNRIVSPTGSVVPIPGGKSVVLQEINVSKANAALICAAVNQFSALLAVAESAGVLLKLRDINLHNSDCGCSACNLSEALTKLYALRGQP
jgi:hypothetical protein